MTGPSPFPDALPEGHAARLADPARLEALRRTGLMDSAAEVAFDRPIRLARQITGCPVSLFSLVDADRQFFKAQQGLSGPVQEERGTPMSHSFCQYVVTEDRPLAVSDARAHPLLNRNGAVSGLGVVAYLGVPVHGPEGEPIGSFCAISDSPQSWTEAQVEALTDLAATVETELRLRQALTERQTLVDELNHRVKNLFALTIGMVRLSQREASDAADLAHSLQERLRALSRAHDLISPAARSGAGPAQAVSLEELVGALLAPHRGNGRMTIEGPDRPLGARTAGSLALALHELATNAAKYGGLAQEDGTLSVTWAISGEADDEQLTIDWAETGRVETEASARPGFGSRLLGICIEDQLGGTLESHFSGEGMQRRIVLPTHRLDL